MFHALQLEPADNVATVVAVVTKNTQLTIQTPGARTLTLATVDDIPFGHKIALQPLRKGEIVVKYGRPIGRATADIPQGGLVGIHNLEGLRGRGDLVQEQGAAK
jgi:altronate dehydratase small subunit